MAGSALAAKTVKPRGVPIAYVLTEDNLRRLDQLISVEIGIKKSWMVFLSDGSYISCTDVAEVLSVPNSSKQAIQTICVNATLRENYEETKGSSVTFWNHWHTNGGSVVYEVRGDDRTVLYLSGKFDKFLNELRQWYTMLMPFWSGILVTLLVNVFIVVVLLHKFHFNTDHWWLLLVSAGIGVLTSQIVSISLRYLYPISFFLIGQGKDRYEAVRNHRSVVGVGLILAIVAGVIATWLAG